MIYDDRRQAGRELGEAIAGLSPSEPVVLGLPRGGVPVAHEVATRLGCPLDVLVVRKIGVPVQPELAMGSVGEGDIVVRNEDVIRLAGVEDRTFQRVLESEREEVARRVSMYRPEADPVSLDGRTAIVVDDGLATGSTARAGLRVLREKRPGEIWLAVPVAPADTVAEMERIADRVVVLQTPKHFGAVGAWYRDFSQTSDDEVKALLGQSGGP